MTPDKDISQIDPNYIEALRASEERFRGLVESSSDWAWEVDVDGVYTYSSSQVEVMLGYTPGDIVGTTIFDMMPPESVEENSLFFKEASKKRETIVAFENVVLHKNGWRIVLETSGVPFYDKSGKLMGYRGSCRDVTERKRAEDELLREKVFSDAAISSLSGIFYVFDVNGRFLRWNRDFEKVLKYPANEIAMLSPLDLFLKDDAVRVKETIAKVFDKGKASVEANLLAKDGSLTPYFFTGARFEIRGMRCLVGIGMDISRIKSLEEHEKVLQEKLSASERRESLSILAGGVAHDLNNILGPMVLLPEMVCEVLENVDSATDEDIVEARQDLAMMSDSARRAAEVIKDLKALSKRGYVYQDSVNVNSVVEDFLKTHEIKSLKSKKQNIEIDCKTDHRNLTVMGSKTDLYRVLLNLIANAVDASGKKGEVLIEVGSVSLEEKKLAYEIIEPGDYAIIRVCDAGDGVSDEVLKRIFEPFVSTKKESGGVSGSGLGLSVVHSIMKDHNGFIDLEKDLNGWSTVFSLYLPLVKEAILEHKSRVKIHSSPKGTEHVLIVDDEPGQRFIAKRSLQKLGYTISEASNGHEALGFFENGDGNEIDLLMLDMIMADGFDGLDVYEAVLKIKPDQKVVIASGHAPEGRGSLAKDLGASWLSKPYSISGLAVTVRNKLDGK